MCGLGTTLEHFMCIPCCTPCMHHLHPNRAGLNPFRYIHPPPHTPHHPTPARRACTPTDTPISPGSHHRTPTITMSSTASGPFYRVAGMSYVRYANLCADYLRSVMKEPFKTKAQARQVVFFRSSPYSDGKAGASSLGSPPAQRMGLPTTCRRRPTSLGRPHYRVWGWNLFLITE